MLNRICRTVLFLFLTSAAAIAQASPGPAQLQISGAVTTPLTLTGANLKGMPRTTIHAVNSHQKRRKRTKVFCLRSYSAKPERRMENSFADHS